MFVFININNVNTEPEQLHILDDLLNILISKDIQNKNAVLGGDFNVILNPP